VGPAAKCLANAKSIVFFIRIGRRGWVTLILLELWQVKDLLSTDFSRFLLDCSTMSIQSTTDESQAFCSIIVFSLLTPVRFQLKSCLDVRVFRLRSGPAVKTYFRQRFHRSFRTSDFRHFSRDSIMPHWSEAKYQPDRIEIGNSIPCLGDCGGKRFDYNK